MTGIIRPAFKPDSCRCNFIEGSPSTRKGMSRWELRLLFCGDTSTQVMFFGLNLKVQVEPLGSQPFGTSATDVRTRHGGVLRAEVRQ